jgi:hypothetical protein
MTHIRNTFLAFALLLFVVPAAAQAGKYHVYSCRTPSGAAAPVDGWSGTLAPGGAWDDYVTDTCSSGGALIAALGDETGHLAQVDRATWSFAVPPFARLTAATMARAGTTAGGGTGNATYQFWLSSPKISSVFDQCVASIGCKSEGVFGQPSSAGNDVGVPVEKLGSQLVFSAGCGGATEPEPWECPAGQGDPNNYAAAIYLYAADLTLEQTAGPSASSVGGELATAATVSGTSDVTFTATDPGAGVYAAELTVDGTPVETTVLDEAGGRCRNVGETTDGLPAFLYVQPCPSSVSADVGLDTSSLSNGAHHLIVRVLDAAGNSAPVLDRTITVDNPAGASAPPPGGTAPGGETGAGNGNGGGKSGSSASGSPPANQPPATQPNGQGASPHATLSARWRRTARTVLTSTFARRETIVGRLTGPSAAPIAGAQIELSATPAFAGAAAVAMRGARTRSDGTFSLTLPAHLSTRAIRLIYRAQAGEPRPAATRTLRLAVKAPLTLKVSPRATHQGGTIRFSGRLLAGPIPSGGKPLILEARSGYGAWIQFHVVRTDRRGRYRSSYRFRFPGPARYRFRVVCEAEADYPFATGLSPAAGVTER